MNWILLHFKVFWLQTKYKKKNEKFDLRSFKFLFVVSKKKNSKLTRTTFLVTISFFWHSILIDLVLSRKKTVCCVRERINSPYSFPYFNKKSSFLLMFKWNWIHIQFNLRNCAVVYRHQSFVSFPIRRMFLFLFLLCFG